ncbi:MAG TPA: YfiR family protein [Polyangiaceae bacterium]
MATKLLAFDRGLPARAGGTVRILVLIDPSEGQSLKIANEFAGAVKNHGRITNLPVEVTQAKFDSAASVAERIKREKIAAVYLSSGLARVAETVAKALKGSDVMTIAAEPSAVIRGIAVGFDLLSGQPKILVNLSQAKAQNVQLPASVLSLALIQG